MLVVGLVIVFHRRRQFQINKAKVTQCGGRKYTSGTLLSCIEVRNPERKKGKGEKWGQFKGLLDGDMPSVD